jgi:hypothetical protein
MGGADQGERDLSGLKRPAMPIKLAENFFAPYSMHHSTQLPRSGFMRSMVSRSS